MVKSMSSVGFIYLVTNLVDGKVYVGLTKLIKKRWGEHLSATKNGSQYPLHRAIRKHGVEKFVVTCIETVTTNREDLIAAEIHHIASYNCLAPNGYNLTAGGEGVDIYAPGVLENMRLGARKRSASPEWQKNHRAASLRRVKDPVWQENQKEGIRNKFLTDPEYVTALSERNRALALDPIWLAKNAAVVKKLVADPVWQEANAEVLAIAHAASSAKAVARDVSLPPKEQARRVRRRKTEQIRVTAQRALLSPVEKEEVRVRQRAAGKRHREKKKLHGPGFVPYVR